MCGPHSPDRWQAEGWRWRKYSVPSEPNSAAVLRSQSRHPGRMLETSSCTRTEAARRKTPPQSACTQGAASLRPPVALVQPEVLLVFPQFSFDIGSLVLAFLKRLRHSRVRGNQPECRGRPRRELDNRVLAIVARFPGVRENSARAAEITARGGSKQRTFGIGIRAGSVIGTTAISRSWRFSGATAGCAETVRAKQATERAHTRNAGLIVSLANATTVFDKKHS
jgi:hypothetical protein